MSQVLLGLGHYKVNDTGTVLRCPSVFQVLLGLVGPGTQQVQLFPTINSRFIDNLSLVMNFQPSIVIKPLVSKTFVEKFWMPSLM